MAFPGTYNFSYYRGDTFDFIVRPKDASGNSFSLDGYRGIITISDIRGPTATVSFEVDLEVNTVDNFVTCSISSGIGRNLDPSTSWVYDIEITNDINVYTLLNGNISVTDDISGAS